MLKRFQTYIEQEPWDEELLRQEKWLNRFCWAVIVLAAIYFAPICLNIFIEWPFGQR